jgi:hypothetical protein
MLAEADDIPSPLAPGVAMGITESTRKKSTISPMLPDCTLPVPPVCHMGFICFARALLLGRCDGGFFRGGFLTEDPSLKVMKRLIVVTAGSQDRENSRIPVQVRASESGVKPNASAPTRALPP